MWWEKRGGGTAEGATRCATCAVSAATAARREHSPGPEPQCARHAGVQSCDRPESLVSPPAPRRRVRQRATRDYISQNATGPGLEGRGIQIPACRALSGAARGTWDSRPVRKWVAHPRQLEKERRRRGGFPWGCQLRTSPDGGGKPKPGIALVAPVHPHPGHEGTEQKGLDSPVLGLRGRRRAPGGAPAKAM